MEKLLHYVWKHKIFPLNPLRTTAGDLVEVLDPGLQNQNAGPDFFNAKLKIGETVWVGNVEIHLQASDWQKHGHDHDHAYDNVILHVVGENNCDVYRMNGELIPQMVLQCPEEVRLHYEELSRKDKYPPCRKILSSLSQLTIHSWLSALQVERFEEKTLQINERLQRTNQNWEDVFFITLARNYGFGLNGDAFETWARSLSLRAVDKHRDDLFQVEAFFFGQAGLLEKESDELLADDYYVRLQKEYTYLSYKFSLPKPMKTSQWKFLRLRPDNFPHIRLAQLAYLYHHQISLFSKVMEAESVADAQSLLTTRTSEYWENHYIFARSSPHRVKKSGKNALNLMLINTVIPFLYAYGMHRGNDVLCERATTFLEQLKAENNYITRRWSEAGLPVTTASDSQALIQLQKNYCDKKDCLRCRFGYEYLKIR